MLGQLSLSSPLILLQATLSPHGDGDACVYVLLHGTYNVVHIEFNVGNAPSFPRHPSNTPCIYHSEVTDSPMNTHTKVYMGSRTLISEASLFVVILFINHVLACTGLLTRPRRRGLGCLLPLCESLGTIQLYLSSPFVSASSYSLVAVYDEAATALRLLCDVAA